MKRRDFLHCAATGALGASALLSTEQSVFARESSRKARLAFIGTGSRGTSLLRLVATRPDVEIVALCDLFRAGAEAAAKVCVDAGKPAPRIHADSETSWKQLLETEKLDAVVVATGWGTHAMIGIAALNLGIYVGCEVPMATTIEDCWKLVEASEKNKTPCMMLENWSFRQDNLAVLNMIRLGLFGEVLHAHCSYSHDCRGHYYYRPDGSERWQMPFFKEHNRNYYPTHALGPILSWLDINAGDRFTEIYSVATAARGVNRYAKEKFGPEHPGATTQFKQGDVVTSILKTAGGKTVVVNLDTQLPRPYANRWMVEGTGGVYDEEKASIYLEGVSPQKDQWEPWLPYQEKYNHRYWETKHVGGHGGTDALLMKLFVDSVVEGTPAPLDVYDGATMSAVVGLSERSIQENRPVEFPDFTRGAWQSRKPYFAPDRAKST